MRRMAVKMRDVQKTCSRCQYEAAHDAIEDLRTEDKKIGQEFVTSRSVALENLHMYDGADEKQNQEYCLSRNINLLNWRASWSPHHGRIWRALVARLWCFSGKIQALLDTEASLEGLLTSDGEAFWAAIL